MTKRSKKRFEAQQIVVRLGSLAHNLIVWSSRWLSAAAAKLREYGFLRLVRDAFQMDGFVELVATLCPLHPMRVRMSFGGPSHWSHDSFGQSLSKFIPQERIGTRRSRKKVILTMISGINLEFMSDIELR